MSTVASSRVAYLPAPGNREVFANVDAPVFSADDCDLILSRLREERWVPAGVADDGHRGSIRPEVRSVLSQPVPLASSHPLCQRLLAVVAAANDRYWRLDLTGFPDGDAPSVLRYESAVADHFACHVDAGPQFSSRKLSFSVQLTDPRDYRGGDLLFPGNNAIATRERGNVTVFSALVPHEVTPVLSGERFALVGWVHGPVFR